MGKIRLHKVGIGSEDTDRYENITDWNTAAKLVHVITSNGRGKETSDGKKILTAGSRQNRR